MEQLADSFCERCGTRYTFHSGPPKGRTAGARILARGLKNYVMSDGTSLDEAMHAARIDTGQQESIRVAEEFHKTFNFCMSCRQYACEKCWNENQGACLTCAPLWDSPAVAPQDHLIIRMRVSRVGQSGAGGPAGRGPGQPDPAATEWPAADLPGQVRNAGDEDAGRADLGSGSAPMSTRPADRRPVDAPAARTPVWPPTPIWPEPAPLPDRLTRAEPATQTEPSTRTEPERPGEPKQPQPHPIELLRTPSWVAQQEQAAADELQEKSQAWKSNDDGWDLWPAEGGSASGGTADAAQKAAEPSPLEDILNRRMVIEPPRVEPARVEPARVEPARVEPPAAGPVEVEARAAEPAWYEILDAHRDDREAEEISASAETPPAPETPGAQEKAPPEDQSRTGEMALTSEELQLIQAQLDNTISRTDSDRSGEPVTELPGVLDEVQVAHEDEAPAVAETPAATPVEIAPEVSAGTDGPTEQPRPAPSFDLIGSLREPIDFAETPAQQPHHEPLLGRLFGRHTQAGEDHGPEPDVTPTAAPRVASGDAATGEPWPKVTRWSERPIEHRDWWAEASETETRNTTAGDAGADSAAEPAAEPAATATAGPAAPEPSQVQAAASQAPQEPEPVVEPVAEPAALEAEPPYVAETPSEPDTPAAPEPELPPEPVQRRLFTMPAATTDRWPMAAPDLPAHRPVEWPAAEPLERRPAAAQEDHDFGESLPRPAPFERPEPVWPPLGATWPVRDAEPAPWPMPEDAAPPPSALAAHRADPQELAESPLVAALWEESSQQVLDRGNVRVCHRCALPVSNHARFCRRCGAKQD